MEPNHGPNDPIRRHHVLMVPDDNSLSRGATLDSGATLASVHRGSTVGTLYLCWESGVGQLCPMRASPTFRRMSGRSCRLRSSGNGWPSGTPNTQSTETKVVLSRAPGVRSKSICIRPLQSRKQITLLALRVRIAVPIAQCSVLLMAVRSSKVPSALRGTVSSSARSWRKRL